MSFIPRRRIATKPIEKLKHLSPAKVFLLQLLDPFLSFRYLTIPWLVEFTGRERTTLRKELRQMAHDPNNFLNLPAEQYRTINVDAKTLVYELGERGMRQLIEKGLAYPHSDFANGRQTPNNRHRSNSFWHEVGVDMAFYAPLFYYSMHSEGEYLLYDFSKFYEAWYPDKLISDPDPLRLTLNGAMLRFDGSPWVSEYKGDHTCFPGIQYDTGSNTGKDYLENQLQQAIDFHKQEGWKKFDFDNCMIPFLFTKVSRFNKALKYLETKPPKETGHIILYMAPDFSDLMHYPGPNDDIMRAGGVRAHHAPWYISTLSTEAPK